MKWNLYIRLWMEMEEWVVYYKSLSISDKQGISTVFVEYMLEIILKSLKQLVTLQRSQLSDIERVQYFIENFQQKNFARKDYLNMFKDITSATASRDLKKGVEEGFFEKKGDKSKTNYLVKKSVN